MRQQVPGGSGNAKAVGFLATLRCQDTTEMAHFLLDVLFILSKLSLVAQTMTAAADVHATLLSVLATLNRYKANPTAKERALISPTASMVRC